MAFTQIGYLWSRCVVTITLNRSTAMNALIPASPGELTHSAGSGNVRRDPYQGIENKP